MNQHFTIAFYKTLAIEGGYSNDPQDSRGQTNYGITARLAQQYGYLGSMKDLTVDEAKRIYYLAFWKALSLDDIAKQSPLISEEIFDSAVHMGEGRASRSLQTALNVLNNKNTLWNDLEVDGKIGPSTLKALEHCIGKQRESLLFLALNCLQGNYYIKLCLKREKDERFLSGWLDKRVLIKRPIN